MDKESVLTIEEAINSYFELSRKYDQYFPIYIKAKSNSFEKYIFEIDYSAEVLDLENAIKPFEGEMPPSNIVINVKSLFNEIKFRILSLIKEEVMN